MALTGFDPSIVSTSINKVKSAYDELIRAVGDEMQTQFVDGMADKWACKDAQDFFAAVESDVNTLIDSGEGSINYVFQSVADSMNDAASHWAQSTGSSYSMVAFAPIAKRLNVSAIQENIGGVRGIDLQNAQQVIAKLPQITQHASDALEQAKNAVASCGFVGGDMQSSIDNSLNEIKVKINNLVSELNSTAERLMNNTVNTYSDLEGKVSQAFAGR